MALLCLCCEIPLCMVAIHSSVLSRPPAFVRRQLPLCPVGMRLYVHQRADVVSKLDVGMFLRSLHLNVFVPLPAVVLVSSWSANLAQEVNM